MATHTHHGPAKRLLIVPTILVIALIGGLEVFRELAPPPVDPAASVLERAPETLDLDDRTCSRGDRDDTDAREVETQLDRSGRVTSGMVVACPAAFDGREVTYVGELVGDVLQRDGGAWVLVNDDAYALEVGPLPTHDDHRGTNSGLSVWLPDDVLPEGPVLGRPEQRGDVVSVRGRIVRTDPADGGGLTLRASSLEVLAPGTTVPQPVDVRQAVLAAVALTVAAALWAARRRARTL
jgi:hypothetical protein